MIEGHESLAGQERRDLDQENPGEMDPSIDELVPSVSSALGEAWANDVVNALRAQTRALVGAWPGTLREARSRVLLSLPAARRSTFDAETLAALSRAVYNAARRHWDTISEPDPEP